MSNPIVNTVESILGHLYDLRCQEMPSSLRGSDSVLSRLHFPCPFVLSLFYYDICTVGYEHGGSSCPADPVDVLLSKRFDVPAVLLGYATEEVENRVVIVWVG